MKTLFVTGGSSRIGGAILDRLAEDFHVLALQHRQPLRTGSTDVEVLAGSLDHLATHRAALQSADIVLHMAGATHADKDSAYFEVNESGTRALVSSCRPSQHLVYVSSRCLGAAGGAYSRSKERAEGVIRASGLSHTIVRPAEVYGASSAEGIDKLLYLAVRWRLLIDFVARPPVTYSPISVEELQHFLLSVVRADSPANKAYTLCNDADYHAKELQQALEEGLQGKVVRVSVPVALLQTLQRAHVPMPFKPDQLARLTVRKPGSNQDARRDFGFRPRSFLDYLRVDLSRSSPSRSATR